MKKFFRILGIVILLIAAFVVVLGLIAPKDVTLERTAVIKGSKEAVFGQMVNFKNWKNWSPWYKMDTATQMDYYGTDGQPGSGYTWKSEIMGVGDMKNASVNGTEMKYELDIKEPFANKAWGLLKAEDAGNGQTKATWTFNSHYGFPKNGFMMIMGMGKMLEKQFDEGLADIKKTVESGKAEAGSSFAIQEVQFPAHTYASVRKTISWSEMDKFFGETYGMLGKAAGQRIIGSPTGIYYLWDEQNQKTDVAAAFPVSGGASVNGATMLDIPATTAYMVEYKGDYAGSAKAHEALTKHIATSGKKQGLVVEEYIIGPEQEKDTTKWTTNIYYLVQ